MRPSQRYNLHPSTHGIDTLTQDSFDVICIGSGWGGRELATRIVKSGHSALIIEKELIGGDCPFWACVPSKLMLFPNEALETATAVGAVKEARIDLPAIFARREAFNANRVDDNLLVPGLLKAGVTLVRGLGKLTGTRSVTITNGNTSKTLTAKLAVAICSGSDPAVPKALQDVDPWTPRDACSAVEAPAHLIIMGGGVVGCEMATAYSSFGSRVTLISSSKTLLPSVDDEVGALIADALKKKGVQVVLGNRVASATRVSGDVVVKLSDGSEISGSELLVAAGRRSGLDVGLDTVGVEAAKTIPVTDTLSVATSDGAPWLYALGDANGLAPFSHGAKQHARIAANAILKKPAQATALLMPQVIFTHPVSTFRDKYHILTDPDCCLHWPTIKAAAKEGKAVREIKAAYQTLASSIQGDGDKGFAQCIVDDQERILGFTLVGHNAGEVIHAGTTAIVAGMKLSDFVGVVPSFPTCSEVYLNLLDAAGY